MIFNFLDLLLNAIKKRPEDLNTFLKGVINSPGGRGFNKISLDMTCFVMTYSHDY